MALVGDIIFDLDGTLVNSAIQCEEIIGAMRAERGFDTPIAIETARQYAGMDGAIMVPALLGEAARDARDDLAEFRARYHELKTPVSALYPGVRTGLEQLLSKGFRLSICSAKPQSLCEKVLADTDIASSFSVVVGGDKAGFCKPDPGHLREVLAMTGGDGTKALYVGDSEVDYHLAERSGASFIFASYGYAKDGHGIRSSYVGSDFSGVIGHILKITNS